MKQNRRRSGVLLHVSSLPGEYGCGSFGKEALDFIDLISSCGFSIWQTLPFGRPDSYGSPYKSVSAFSTNPFFIDLPTLYAKGLITSSELDGAKQDSPYSVEFERLFAEREILLGKASSRLSEESRREVRAFADANPGIKNYCGWLVKKYPAVPTADDQLLYRYFCEYEFHSQWEHIREYAAGRNVRIMGDIPFYVDGGGCDTDSYPDIFLQDASGCLSAVAGCPPDAFSDDGQLWGNPLYDWDEMRKTGYSWWRDRIRFCFSLFDILRIDHFRAVESFWSVPAGASTARAGRWVKGPGMEFVDVLKSVSDDREIVAEDLGADTPGLIRFMAGCGLPGMKVMQFGNYLNDCDDPHVPCNYTRDCFAYTGTHDNNTLLGWAFECDPSLRKRFFSFCGYGGDNITDGCRAAVRTLFASCADTVLIPLQDMLFYGRDTRMNTPGEPDGNWRYRATADAMSAVDRVFFTELNNITARYPYCR